jgi:hypothetical protein
VVPTFPFPALDGGEKSASRPGSLYLRGKHPCTQWIRRTLGSRTGMEAVQKRKICGRASQRRDKQAKPRRTQHDTLNRQCNSNGLHVSLLSEGSRS